MLLFPKGCALLSLSLVLSLSARIHGQSIESLKPTELRGLSYTNQFFPGATYDPAVPTPGSLLGFPIGQRAANNEEIDRCLHAWAGVSNRTRLVEYARSYENRPLHYMMVSSSNNLARLPEIQAGLARLGDPRGLAETNAQHLIDTLPAVAWLAFTIHGDETEGSDAALALLYHLVAANDAETRKLRRELVMIVDPVMNPDGRDRFIKMIGEHRGAAPNVDDRSLLHTGYWPWGRGNHYHFDLNRDFIVGAHPETRGRIREVARWNPLLFVDAHGMGPQDTFLFAPPREPINLNFPKNREHWGDVFAQDQARAFDEHHWLYYHGEWNEGWYPGYADSWPVFRGAVGILYETPSLREDGVRRPEGRILTYRESIHHHVTGAMANLKTLQAHAKTRLREFYEERREAVAPQGRYAKRTFAILPTPNEARLGGLVQWLQYQGIEVYQATNEFKVEVALDQLGRESKNRSIPAGSMLIPNRQPLAPLVATLLEFDPQIPKAALEDERQELLRKSQSRIYDITAWNLTMLFGVEALTLNTDLPSSARLLAVSNSAPHKLVSQAADPVGWVIDGADDRSAAAAARLMERGLQVRVAEKPFKFDQHQFARGSVIVTRLDNQASTNDLTSTLRQTIEELGLSATAISTGLALGDLPNLGGQYFTLLAAPRIAVFSRGGISTSDFGAVWFLIDHQVGIRHSHLDESTSLELQRYNVLVLPERMMGALTPGLLGELKTWVRAGGTLIALGSSAGEIAADKAAFTKARVLPEVLGKLAEYEQAIFREWEARDGRLPGLEQLWSHQPPKALAYPWPTTDSAYPEEKELKKREAWQRLFMPQGALVAGRVDARHWLTFGCTEPMPILVGHQPVLMAAEGVEAPIRYGVMVPAEKKTSTTTNGIAAASAKTDASKKDKKELSRLGWSALPKGQELYMRMSGLLWPEAAHRLANAAWVTRESLGRGQIILFATSPAFRGTVLAPRRVLLNALIYGPGFGAAPVIQP